MREVEGLGLADALQSLREELGRAVRDGKDSAIGFRIRELKVELTLYASTTVKGEGGIKWLVVSAGATGQYEDAQTQKVTLSLEAIDEGNEPLSRIRG